MKNIVILATGGTIAGVSYDPTDIVGYHAGIVPIEEIVKAIEPIKKIANITTEQITQIDSADMNCKIWFHLAERINTLLKQPDLDGIVVTHGTDTLEETAYFLNLVVKSQKPVVLVGAMRPSTAISPDGPMNLYNAIVLAVNTTAWGKGILVSLNDTINSSREVTKSNTALQDTFKAPELGCLGYIIDGHPHFYRMSTRKHTYMSDFDISGIKELPAVDIIYGYVNDTGMLAKAAASLGVKGIVYAGLGNGNMSQSMKNTFREIQNQGVVVVRSTRTGNGVVTQNDTFSRFVAADNLSPQKARILLMLALTKTSDPKEIQEMFWTY
ncbi:MAG: type II asparaginase [Veillonellales bacterium]